MSISLTVTSSPCTMQRCRVHRKILHTTTYTALSCTSTTNYTYIYTYAACATISRLLSSTRVTKSYLFALGILPPTEPRDLQLHNKTISGRCTGSRTPPKPRDVLEQSTIKPPDAELALKTPCAHTPTHYKSEYLLIYWLALITMKSIPRILCTTSEALDK